MMDSPQMPHLYRPVLQESGSRIEDLDRLTRVAPTVENSTSPVDNFVHKLLMDSIVFFLHHGSSFIKPYSVPGAFMRINHLTSLFSEDKG